MTTPRTRLAELLGGVGAAGSFAARRTAAPDDLDLEVKGLGRLRLPVSRADAERLCRLARPAHYGRGEQTLLDRRVRDTWEVPKSRVAIDRRRWNRTLVPVLDALRADLGLPDGYRLEAELHSMLVYGPGQFFLPHRDSEKADDMVATLVVTLPGAFSGGALAVEHRGETVAFRGSKKTISFVAFYADCLHEVQPVKAGYRVVLTYNLLLAGGGAATAGAAEIYPATVETLAGHLRDHFETPRPPPRHAPADAPPRQPPARLVYLLDHRYTERGFGWDRLKGSDAARTAVLAAAAERAGCETVLALAEIQETWDCVGPESEDRRYGRHRRWAREFDDEEWDEEEPPPPPPRDDPDRYSLGDLIDSSITLGRWIDPAGTRAAPIVSAVGPDEVCATTPTASLEPYAAEYEGYMGNYGNTMDRWYRRAALVVWPRERAFAVRAEADPAWGLAAIERRLRSGDGGEAGKMAAALVPFWERVAGKDERPRLFGPALRVAEGLDDPPRASALLAPFHVETLAPAQAPAWAGLLARYGEAWMRALLAAWAGRRDWMQTPERERLAWLAALPRLCTALSAADGGVRTETTKAGSATRRAAKTRAAGNGTAKHGTAEHDTTTAAGVGTRAARLLVEDASRRLRAAIEQRRELSPPSERDRALAELAAPLFGLLAGAAAAGADDLRDHAVDFLCAPEDDLLLPVLVRLLRAAERAGKPVARAAPALDAVALHCTARLKARLARRARRKDDWSIALPAGCDCELCRTLGSFLADPTSRRLEWPLAKERRMHVHRRLDDGELPVRHETRRSGSPYTLVLAKTEALFEREALERRAWQDDLAWLGRRSDAGAQARLSRRP